MGFIGSLFNSSQGAGYQAQGPNAAAVSNAQSQMNNAYGQQQSFLNAVTSANPNLFSQQAGLTNQLQNLAAGQGPNPALTQLAQTTGQNTQNQAALMAGQRGVQNNPGLMARQIAQTGAQNQQAAANQAATLSAQQQLGAMNQLGGQLNQISGEEQGAIGGLGQIAGTNQGQLLGLQANANDANSRIAGANAQGQQQMLGGVLGGLGTAAMMAARGGLVTNQGMLNRNYADGGMVPHYAMGSMIDTSTLPGAQQIPQANQYSLTDTQLPQSLGGPMVAPQANKYSLMDNSNPLTNIQAPTIAGPKSSLGKMSNGFNNAFNSKSPLASGMSQLTSGLVSGAGNAIKSAVSSNADSSTSSDNDYSTGGKVPAKVSPGEKYLKPYEVKEVAEGKVNPKSVGEKIPGHAKVKGDSPKNDTVSKDLIPGGVVVPRSKVKDPEKLTRFVNAILGMHKVGG